MRLYLDCKLTLLPGFCFYILHRPRQERQPSDHMATMWLNKNGLLQPDDVIVYCIQSTQHDVSQAGGIYATLGRDNYLWPGGHKP